MHWSVKHANGQYDAIMWKRMPGSRWRNAEFHTTHVSCRIPEEMRPGAFGASRTLPPTGQRSLQMNRAEPICPEARKAMKNSFTSFDPYARIVCDPNKIATLPVKSLLLLEDFPANHTTPRLQASVLRRRFVSTNRASGSVWHISILIMVINSKIKIKKKHKPRLSPCFGTHLSDLQRPLTHQWAILLIVDRRGRF